MTKNNLLDRFEGCLLGVGIGDALGLPVEGWAAKKIRANYSYINNYLEGVLAKGSISDDTQLTLLLAESLQEKNGFDAADFAQRLKEWPSYQIGGGLASLTAAARLAKGIHYCESGVKSAGCGGAMRVAPIGLFYSHASNELATHAVEQARITHSDPRATAGAYVVAQMVANGVNSSAGFDDSCFPILLERTRKISPEMAAHLDLIPKLLESSWEEAINVLGSSGFVLETVASAIWAFWRNSFSFSDAVLGAVNLGGDTDSRGAITGAIAGAYLGKSQIPAPLLNDLNQEAALRLSQLAGVLLSKAAVKD